MARTPSADDGIRSAVRQREQVRGLRIRERQTTQPRTYIVGGTIDPDLYIPPFYISVNPAAGDDPDDPTADSRLVAEWKQIVLFAGVVRTGAITVAWQLDGVTIATGHDITDTPPNRLPLAEPVEVPDGAFLRPIVTDGSATDASLAVVFAASPR